MNPTLIAIISFAGLGFATWTAVPALRDRWINGWHLVGLGVLEVGLLVQAILATARMIGGARPEEFATFIGYLITSVVLLPLAALLGLMERTRWGTTVIAVSGLVVAVLCLRLRQVWGRA